MSMGEPKYFFSYSRKDTEFVLKVAKELRAVGVDLWLDQLDIVGGDRWDRAIEEALKTCQGVIAVLSPESLASNNVMDEVSYALEEGKLVVPVLLHPCNIPLRLRRVQHVDFTSDYAVGFSRLLRALHIEQSSAATEPSAPQKHVAQQLEDEVVATATVAGKPPKKQITQQTVVVVGDETSTEVVAKLRKAKVSVIDDRSSIGSASLVVIANDATNGPMPLHKEILNEIARTSNRELLWILTKSSEVDDPELLELIILQIHELLKEHNLPDVTIQVAVDGESFKSSSVDLKGWPAIIRFVAGRGLQ
jgi:hypothetical protein